MKALTSTEDCDLLVLGSGAGGNPSKSTRTLRPTSTRSQAVVKTYNRYAKTVIPGFNSSKGGLDVNGEKLSPRDGASTDEERELHLASEKGAHFLLFDLH
jgi:hypothetical protein